MGPLTSAKPHKKVRTKSLLSSVFLFFFLISFFYIHYNNTRRMQFQVNFATEQGLGAFLAADESELYMGVPFPSISQSSHEGSFIFE